MDKKAKKKQDKLTHKEKKIQQTLLTIQHEIKHLCLKVKLKTINNLILQNAKTCMFENNKATKPKRIDCSKT